MDDLTRSWYEMAFRCAFVEKRGNEFQDFFASIMEKRYPADFVRVRPWGRHGDRKNDGYLPSTRTLFQVYAPNEMSSEACIAKIDEDFTGALPHWKAFFDTWIFVHNSREGLGPDQTKRLLTLNEEHAEISVSHWGYEELRREVFELAPQELASLLGPAPTRHGFISLGLEELQPVLDHISVLPPTPEPDVRPVPADKLAHNLLSDAVETLLRAGMTRSDLVQRYFGFKPTLQDEMAEAFRAKYAELRASGATPDEVFTGLRRYAQGGLDETPSLHCAVLAVLAFFFEECDIFERPNGTVGGQS